MIEAGVLVTLDRLIWHLPEGRTAGSIPDTRMLWDNLWTNKETVIGFAHSHPGGGEPSPSMTDLTTFLAVENGLGKYLTWWVISSTHVTEWKRGASAPDPESSTERPRAALPVYEGKILSEQDCLALPWLPELRRLSYESTNP